MELVTGVIRPRRPGEVRNAQGLVGFRREIASRPKVHRGYSPFGNARRDSGWLRTAATAYAGLGRRLVNHQWSALLRRKAVAQQSTRIAASVELQPLNGSV